jgi:hypothetical protein
MTPSSISAYGGDGRQAAGVVARALHLITHPLNTRRRVESTTTTRHRTCPVAGECSADCRDRYPTVQRPRYVINQDIAGRIWPELLMRPLFGSQVAPLT